MQEGEMKVTWRKERNRQTDRRSYVQRDKQTERNADI